MTIRATERCALAERICRRWIKRRGIRLRAPQVYVVRRRGFAGLVWGYANRRTGKITLHLGIRSNKRDHYILLAHEFSHYLHWHTTPRRSLGTAHGERFQRILWGTLPYGLWKRASSTHWARGPSAHRPQFQPDRGVGEEFVEEAYAEASVEIIEEAA
jgi:hypothetical protein